jgi:hypothetical protein
LASLIDDEKKLGDCQLDLWKQSYVAAYAAVFGKLQRSAAWTRSRAAAPRCPSSKGDLMVVANAADSRVVLGTASDDGAIMSSSSSST